MASAWSLGECLGRHYCLWTMVEQGWHQVMELSRGHSWFEFYSAVTGGAYGCGFCQVPKSGGKDCLRDSSRVDLEPGCGNVSGITFEFKVGRLVTSAWFLLHPLVEGAGGRTLDKLYYIWVYRGDGVAFDLQLETWLVNIPLLHKSASSKQPSSVLDSTGSVTSNLDHKAPP